MFTDMKEMYDHSVQACLAHDMIQKEEIIKIIEKTKRDQRLQLEGFDKKYMLLTKNRLEKLERAVEGVLIDTAVVKGQVGADVMLYKFDSF